MDVKYAFSNRKFSFPRYILYVVIFLAFFLLISNGISSLNQSSIEQEYKALEDAIVRSCVHTYSTTGAYPSSIDYLVEHYGIQIDESKYTVYLNGFAANLMPDITIIRK